VIPWRPARRGPEAAEWLDAGDASPEETARCYRELEQVNRRLGGYRATFAALDAAAAVLDRPPRRPLEALDVAGGDGAFAARLRDWGRARGHATRAWLVDLNPRALDAARGRLPRDGSVRLVRSDALALPFAERALDVVHCSAFFHHLSTLQARDLLAEMCRVSRAVVVVNDLVRSWVAWGAIGLLTRLLGGSPLVRHDGPLSVRKAFVPSELAALAQAIDTTVSPGFRWTVERTFPYRMTLLGARWGRRDVRPGEAVP